MGNEYLQSESLSFQPLSIPRPRGSHRFEVWSPKLHRRLTFYRDISLTAWVNIESDCCVECFCENPHQLKLNRRNLVVDFWVKYNDRQAFVFVVKSDDFEKTKAEIVDQAGFFAFTKSNGIAIEYITTHIIEEKSQHIENWKTILHFLTANERFLTPKLTEQVARHAAEVGKASLGAIKSAHADDDPALITTAVFNLLQRGMLQSHDLATAALCDTTEFVVA